MSWKKLAAGVGIDAFTRGLKSLEGQVSKRQYKRLLATAVAQVLALHPDLGRGAARRKARSVVGARPAKALGKKVVSTGLELAVAAGTAAVAGKIVEKVRARSERKQAEHAEHAAATAADAGVRENGHDGHEQPDTTAPPTA